MLRITKLGDHELIGGQSPNKLILPWTDYQVDTFAYWSITYKHIDWRVKRSSPIKTGEPEYPIQPQRP